jgi:mono/diheme cytochrome c family protein
VRININIICRLVAIVVLAGVGLGACAARLPEPNVADAERAAKVWPGTTLDDLHRGKQQYVQRCSGCHGLIDPHQFQAGRWPVFVKEMSGKLQISSSEVVDLTRYLVVASESPQTH